MTFNNKIFSEKKIISNLKKKKNKSHMSSWFYEDFI